MAVIHVLGDRSTVGIEPAGTLATLFAVLGFFAALMLFAANPFAVIDDVPLDGHGLNPMLQDPAMVAHPADAVPGLRRIHHPIRDGHWRPDRRPARQRLDRANPSLEPGKLAVLSIGILLGAQWAYVELGWGGYWAWDPVENASLCRGSRAPRCSIRSWCRSTAGC
jgi:cytochrome c-type biogenesis protein CcmF